jgi:hypothetical protein
MLVSHHSEIVRPARNMVQIMVVMIRGLTKTRVGIHQLILGEDNEYTF